MDDVTLFNPDTEFVLVSTMLPNPELVIAAQGKHKSYLSVLQQLTRPGVVMADMTSISEELLRHKTFQDMTSNNVNHPNDYLVRWYAQVMARLLVPQTDEDQNTTT
jgi:hypothetical protein